jgi:hypothetical protein
MVTNELLSQLGPLAYLIGTWEGSKGDDIAPSDDRGTENNKYRERVVFEQAGLVQNHEQNLHVLRYNMRAWRIGESDSFHEELGYWIWEPKTHEIMRCFLIPRGIALIASGKSSPHAKEFTLRSDAGSCTNGICSNPFLDKEFKMLSYEVNLTIHSNDSYSYSQDTVLMMPRKSEPFHHTDKNTLIRVT